MWNIKKTDLEKQRRVVVLRGSGVVKEQDTGQRVPTSSYKVNKSGDLIDSG